MTEVVGREAELRAAAAALERAAAGLEILLIRGDAGIGKTTIWSAIVDRAASQGRRVLVARATAAEAALTLTILADLLEPIVGSDAGEELTASLPEPQRVAIAAALLRIQPTTGNLQPRLIGAAVRSLLARLAQDRPLAIAVDDAQWIDPPSAAALTYALRRLADAPIALVIAQRAGENLPIDLASIVSPERVTTLDVGPLSLAATHELLRARLGIVPSRATLVRIHDAAVGSPLFAIEIARALEEIGPPAAGAPLPVPANVEALLADRVRRLGASTRHVLLLAAILGRAPTALIDRILGRSVDEDLRLADAAGIARERGGLVRFIHPLYAAAIEHAAQPNERRQAHQDVAEAVERPEEQARHLALAARGPDEAIAAALVAAAVDADARGAPAAAAELYELAIGLTPREASGAIEQRTLARAAALQRAGEPGRAEAILGELIGSTTSPNVRARSRLALAAIRYETDATSAAVELCEAAIVDAADDPELRCRALAGSAAVEWRDLVRRATRVNEAYALLATLSDPDPALVGLVLMVRMGQDNDLGRPFVPEMIERGLAAERLAPAPNVSERFSAALGVWLKYRDQFDEARAWMERTHQAAIDEGDDGSLPYALSHLPEVELWTGHWARARELAVQHLELARDLGLESQRRQATYNAGLVDVHEGHVDAARAELEPVLRAAEADGDVWTIASIEPLLGLLELSLGNAAKAAEHLQRSSRYRGEIGQSTPRRGDQDLVEALLGIGDLDGARAVVDEMSRRARRHGVHSALACAARARGLVDAASGDTAAALEAIDEALAEHELGRIPFDRARTLLALGSIRRRRRERAAAGQAFGEALSIFEGLGARLWADRARQDLDRVRLHRASRDALTEGERRVAELVASGMTNREVAASLFMSPKTVEANLARAYSKLGIKSRAQLGAWLAAPREM